MNMHIAQSTVTAVELSELASVTTQIISPRECKPIISVVQDIALGIFRITKGNILISDKDMMNFMATNFKFDGSIPKPHIDKNNIKKWTGRQAISTIIPKNITLKRPNKNFDDKNTSEKEMNDNYVIIENGELLQGTLDKTLYQDRTKGLVHAIVNECGNEEARLFFDNTQKLICNYLVRAGFSVGISDLIIDDDTILNLKTTIHDMKVKVYDIIKTIHSGQFENKSIIPNNEYFEDEVNAMLNKTRDIVGKMALAKIDDNLNRMINMVKSGSKGSILNVSQMIACLGQQNVDGKRIGYGFDDRTLPHYPRFDDGPDSHGFIENSFITGLSPQEFYFHSMAGREGLIDTAVKTLTILGLKSRRDVKTKIITS
jgi:DNA-directed RNA polymerase II subunit RPB1